MTIYQVIDDREGMHEVLATYDNEEAAETHRAALEKTDDAYGQYFLVEQHTVKNVKSEFTGIDED